MCLADTPTGTRYPGSFSEDFCFSTASRTIFVIKATLLLSILILLINACPPLNPAVAQEHMLADPLAYALIYNRYR